MATRFRVRGLGLLSVLKFGLILGAIGMVLPSACLTFAFAGAVSGARKFLEGWNRVTIPLLLGQQISLDLIQMLNMRGPLDSLRSVDDRFWIIAPILLISIFLIGTIAILVTGLTMAIFYNLISRGSGGLVIDLEPTER